MRELIYDPRPRQDFPLSDRYVERCTGADSPSRTAVQGFFPQTPEQMAERAGWREKIKELLTARQYSVRTEHLRDDSLTSTLLMPFNQPPFAFVKGHMYNVFWGHVEAAHVPAMIKMLRESTSDAANRVLDLGSGVNFESKVRYERICKNITYLDKLEPAVQMLKDYLSENGEKNVRREYVIGDKEHLSDVLPPQSISTIIRCGVFETSRKEMEGISAVGTDDLQLFVSNSIERQPIDKFLDIAEQYFPRITAHVGMERYALVCGKK